VTRSLAHYLCLHTHGGRWLSYSISLPTARGDRRVVPMPVIGPRRGSDRFSCVPVMQSVVTGRWGSQLPEVAAEPHHCRWADNFLSSSCSRGLSHPKQSESPGVTLKVNSGTARHTATARTLALELVPRPLLYAMPPSRWLVVRSE